MSSKDTILDILGGEDMLRFMVDAKGFCCPDDSSVRFFVRDKQVDIKERKDFLASGVLFYSIRVANRHSGEVLNKHSAVYDTSLVKDLLEWDLNLSISF